MASEGICRHCGSPRRKPRTEHSGNQEFGPLTPPSGTRRRRTVVCETTIDILTLQPDLPRTGPEVSYTYLVLAVGTEESCVVTFLHHDEGDAGLVANL